MTVEPLPHPDAPTDTRDRLLLAAIDAFAERGFAGTSTRDIASRASMSPAAVYVHYSTKEELLFETSLRGHAMALASIEAASNAAQSPLERVRTMIHDFSRWHAINSRVGRIVQYEFGALTPEHRAIIAQYRRDIEAVMARTLADGVDEGSLAVTDIKGTARALLSLSVDLVRWYNPARSETAENLAALHAELASRMVAAPTI